MERASKSSCHLSLSLSLQLDTDIYWKEAAAAAAAVGERRRVAVTTEPSNYGPEKGTSRRANARGKSWQFISDVKMTFLSLSLSLQSAPFHPSSRSDSATTMLQ